VSAGWVAAGVRSRAIARRRLGPASARALVTGSAAGRFEALAASPYRDHIRSDDPAGVAHGLAATLLWNLRVLAGWQPPRGVVALRLLAGWFEIANVDEHLRMLRGRPAEPPFALGNLATAWPRLAATGSREELCAVLAASPWGDPGGAGSREIQLGMRLRWAERVATVVAPARPWAMGAAALLLACERTAGRPLPPRAAMTAGRLLGRAAGLAGSLDDLRRNLPGTARWVLDGVPDTLPLWQAEVRWWRRVGADGSRMLRGSRFGIDHTVGAAAVLAADARLTRAALECAAHPRGDPAVFDAVA
jgi:hypothetical protein